MTRQEHETLVLSKIHDLFEYKDGTLYRKPLPRTWFKTDRDHVIFNARCANKPVLSLCPYGYIRASITLDGIPFTYKAHKLVWAMEYGYFPDKPMDHINHDRTDNRLSNLRVVTFQDNARNRRRPVNNTSGKVGVIWNARANKWAAAIKIDGVRKHLGYFKNKDDAIAAREAADIEFGFHENHGG